MELSFLMDEDTEEQLAEFLQLDGHDVERVVEVPELGPGSNDADVQAYAQRTDRIIVTYDNDHIERIDDPSTHSGVFFCVKQELDSYTIREIIQAIVDHYDSKASMKPVVYVSENWL